MSTPLTRGYVWTAGDTAGVSTATRQLSFVQTPSVRLVFHSAMQPPDATGPDEWGAYAAVLPSDPAVTGWGRTERQALSALAGQLRALADEEPVRDLSAIGQALVAAQRMPVDSLENWLAGIAGLPVLHEPGVVEA